MKTPEQLAEEWIETNGWNTEPFRDEYTIEFRKQGYVAGYQAAAPQWISVKDRLPNSTPMVLAMCIDGYELAYYGNYGKGQWTNTLGTEYLNVTHWMPLPEPPKGEA